MLEFTIPFKQKNKRFRKCEECGKKKFTSKLYDVYDTGLNYYQQIICCNKCLKEAKERCKNDL